jgi:hypothetical protein
MAFRINRLFSEENALALHGSRRMGCIHASRDLHALEPQDERMERRSAGPLPLHARCKLTPTPRRYRLSVEVMPQLPRDCSRRRTAWPGSGSCGNASHGGSTDSAGPTGRRQHAGVWQEPKPLRDHGTRSVPRNPASPQSTSGRRCISSGSHGRARSQTVKEASWRPLG